MALTFGAATSDRVSATDAALIQNMDPFTVLLWCYPTTLTAGRRLFFKAPGTPRTNCEIAASTTNVLFERGRATTAAAYTTSSGPLALNTWCFLACVFNSGASAGEVMNVYQGRLGSAATECTYSATNDGSGALGDDSGQNWFWGNRSAANAAFQGLLAEALVVEAALTLPEIVSWQFGLLSTFASVRFGHRFGYEGTSTLTDITGNGFTGTITGATQGNHVPLAYATRHYEDDAYIVTATPPATPAYAVLLGEPTIGASVF